MAVVCQPSLLRAVCIALLMVVAIGAGSEAFAQRPSQAQINAMRQSCRSDYMAHCSSVPTGGAPALNCLKQNLANLSPGCQTAVKAIAPESPPAAASTASPSQAAPPAPAPSMSTPNMSTPSAPAAPPTATAQPSAAGAGRASQAQLRSVRQSCGADYRVHCAGIPPGGSASIACLKRNITTLSGQCKQALGAGATAAATPAVAPPPVEPAPLLVSPREELFVLRMACGGDYAAFCRGLRPGAGRIAACLHYNSASLSPRCQQALTALREGR
jgi:cysteine rich repeat protein